MTSPTELFTTQLQLLRGQPCWLVVGGAGTGSNIVLHIGARVPRKQWLGNPFLGVEGRHHEGEYLLYVECPWRLEKSSTAVVGSWLDAQDAKLMRATLALIENQTIEECSVTPPANDLELVFSAGHRLRLFCDQRDTESGDNYTLFTPRYAIANMGGFRLTAEPRIEAR
jgi:hypothetical protein